LKNLNKRNYESKIPTKKKTLQKGSRSVVQNKNRIIFFSKKRLKIFLRNERIQPSTKFLLKEKIFENFRSEMRRFETKFEKEDRMKNEQDPATSI
jgi:hypothetical protein